VRVRIGEIPGKERPEVRKKGWFFISSTTALNSHKAAPVCRTEAGLMGANGLIGQLQLCQALQHLVRG